MINKTWGAWKLSSSTEESVGPTTSSSYALPSKSLSSAGLLNSTTIQTPPDWSLLLERSEFKILAADEVIIEEGKVATPTLYQIANGSVTVVKQPNDCADDPKILSTLERGDIFGELSMLDSRAASATVVAAEPTELHLLRASYIYELFKVRQIFRCVTAQEPQRSGWQVLLLPVPHARLTAAQTRNSNGQQIKEEGVLGRAEGGFAPCFGGLSSGKSDHQHS